MQLYLKLVGLGVIFFPLQLKKIIVISGVKTVICQLNQLITLIHLKKLKPLINFTGKKKNPHASK